MPTSPYRIVIDTNTLLRGVLSKTSAAAKLRRAAENRLFILLLSKPVLDEYRAVLGNQKLNERFPELTSKKINYLIKRLLFVGEYIRNPRSRFAYGRDPRDEKFIELAIELSATHIVSSDKDLLALSHDKGDAGTRFRQRLPSVTVQDAASFVQQYEAELRHE